MSTVLTDAFVHVAGYDFTGDSNMLKLDASVDAKDSTTFGSGGWKEIEGSIRNVEMQMAGYQDAAGAVDAEAFAALGTQVAYTAGLVETAGQAAYMFEGAKFNYELFGAVGELAPFSLGCYHKGSYGLVRGKLMKARGNVSATGALGSALELGAVAADQRLYATFHVFTAATTITAVLESDEDNTFASATTRATVGPLIATGGTWVTPISGAITDTWFRWRVTAVTGTFNVSAAAAIQ